MAVTPTTGKTHPRWARLLVDGHNLSGDSRSLAGVGFTSTPADVTGWVDYMENIKGQKTVNFGAYQALFNNKEDAPSVNAGTHTVLGDGLDDAYVSVAFGINESPTIGAPAFSATLTQFSYLATVANADAVVINADWQGGESVVAGWGTMLSTGATQSATITLDSFDNGATMPNGAIWFYQIQQSEGAMGANDWELKIEHAPDDSTWATASSITSIGADVTGGILTNTSSVDRYTRIDLTKTAGTDLKIWVMQLAL